MKKGKVIVLSGVSSSGKSTLSRVLQDRVSEAFFVICADDFMEMLGRSKYVDISDEAHFQYYMAEIYTTKALSDMGLNIIIDTVFFTDEIIGLKEWVELFHDSPALLVHVTCPLEELRRRERERGDREIGQGESQIATLYPQDIFDITVDNYKNTKEECADKIIELLNSGNFAAFKTLWLQRNE